MTAPWQQARRILCVRLDSLGDVLMCTPAMRALRQAVPGRTLTLLGSPAGTAALPFIPELDDAITWEAPWTNFATRGEIRRATRGDIRRATQGEIRNTTRDGDRFTTQGEIQDRTRDGSRPPAQSKTQHASPGGIRSATWGEHTRGEHTRREHRAATRSEAAADPDGTPAALRPAPALAQGSGLALVAMLAARAFDAAVIFTTYTQSALPAALLCQLAGIPLRLAHCRENPYALLTDWIPDPEPATLVRHEVQRQLALVQRVGCRNAAPGLSFVLRPADTAAARRCLGAAGIDPDRPWILVHPGASAASRRYPPGHWAHVLRLLAQDARVPLVLTGSAAEAGLIDGIQFTSAVPAVSLAGRLSLGELGAALRLAAVAVTNNTGPAHMAAAVGTPVVDLYALTNPQHTPWNVRSRVLFHDVPCRFCYKSTCPEGHQACLAGVAPERVAAAVHELLGKTRPHGTGTPAEPPATPVSS